MQDPTCDLLKASEHAKSLRDVMIKKERPPIQWRNMGNSDCLSKSTNFTGNRPRVASPQQHRKNVLAPTMKECWQLKSLPAIHGLFRYRTRRSNLHSLPMVEGSVPPLKQNCSPHPGYMGNRFSDDVINISPQWLLDERTKSVVKFAKSRLFFISHVGTAR